MDFSFTEAQITVGELAREIFENEVTPERLTEFESSGEAMDRALWSTLAEAGLLSLAVDEDLGGMGMGLLEICTLLGESGRVLAPVPILPTLVLGALPIAAFGTEAQRQCWLPAVARGDSVLTAALAEQRADGELRPAVAARHDGSDWLLNGTASLVPAATVAARVLVAATCEEGTAIFLVDPGSSAVMVTSVRSSCGETLADLSFENVRVHADDLLGGIAPGGASMLRWIYERGVVAVCAKQVGVSERALEVTCSYVAERKQFGVPVGSFQAVQHRSADAYIDLQAMRWVAWRAAWKLASGQEASREVAVAKFWAAEGGARIAAAAQHLHGGIGVDLDYPVHRYFLWSKALELSHGAAAAQLVRIGRDMAATGPAEGA